MLLDSVASNLSVPEEGYEPIFSTLPSTFDYDEEKVHKPDLECKMKAVKSVSAIAEKEKEKLKKVVEEKTYLTNRIDTAEALSPFVRIITKFVIF